ncbi:MAG: class I SAM-dependent RNA methyltransferase, partial [Acidobacteria bacterium]|nr:class I SAM-dependent RNA methyltransferase [Acidobacteriota bacterium]
MPGIAQPIELTVEKLVYGGQGLSRAEGRVALTPFVLPGEKILAEVARESKGLLETRLAEVLSAAPERVPAPCPYFARCGGCHYQHAPYGFQLEAKRRILRETLVRIGKIEAPGEIGTIAGEPWNYRNRSQLHLAGGEIGYLEAGSHRLCPVEFCPISSPKINQALAVIRRMMRDPRWPGFLQRIELFSDEQQVQLNVREAARRPAARFFDWCSQEIPGWVPGALEYAAAGGSYRVSGDAFFQVNRFLVDALVEEALAGAGGESAIDLYAGVGLFSLPLAARFERVTAVESSAGAVADLRFNAARAGARIEAAAARAEQFLDSLPRAPDLLLLDPPRAGLSKAETRRILELKPAAIVIVSCDPATLARDLAALAAAYRIERMTLVDLFPQTYHLETVVKLGV